MVNGTIPYDLRDTFKDKLNNIKSISDKTHYEKLPLSYNNSFIEFGGLFSIFDVQKQNIIQDYGDLLDLEGATIDLEDMEEHTFQPISSVETDPSQQSILHSLESTRNILIQGPPGTGKSQSLTAILVNALENQKKTIVVCEKITALNVLKKALDKRGLSNLNVQITEVQKSGRKNAVFSVRDRIENTQYRRYRYTHSKETLDNIIDKAKSLIDSINKKHLKLSENLIGSKNWTHIVGSLLSELKGNEEEYNLDIEKETFKYDSTELNYILELIRKGQNLYNDFKPNKDDSFLNPLKLVGDNPFLIEQQLEDDFSNYKSELISILVNISKFESEYNQKRKSQLTEQLQSIYEIDSAIQKLLNKNKNNEDFYQEEKTNRFFYKTISLFSQEKKQTRIDQQLVNSFFSQLNTTIESCIDFDSIKLPNEIKGKVSNLSAYKKAIEETKTNFNNKVKNEFKSLNLIKKINQDYDTETLQLIKSKLDSLKGKITLDNWSTAQLNTKTEETLINSIQEIIQKKEDYYADENDLFFSEFKWFQFYNSLSPENKIIIDQLLDKVNWKKVFLIYYLN